MSRTADGRVATTFWAQVVPVWMNWYPGSLKGIRVMRITQRKPREPEPGCVLVKLTISLPESAFVPDVVEGSVELAPGEWLTVPATVGAEPIPAMDEPGGENGVHEA